MAQSHGISLKKKYGQHFLRDAQVLNCMFEQVKLDSASSVFEIGGGDGFLTRKILQHPIARLWVFEIDPEWVTHLKKTITDDRLRVIHTNILDVDLDTVLKTHAPWILLANLPYQVTFPILHTLQENRHLLKEGVIMVQEEVAQKIIKKSGRGYGYSSLFFQHYFNWTPLDKVKPSAFYPPPQVDSRLLYFKPRIDAPEIPEEEQFWRFIKALFASPRRTIKNNLASTHYSPATVPAELLTKRGQELSMSQLLELWKMITLAK